MRGLTNLGCLIFLNVGLVTLLYAFRPIKCFTLKPTSAGYPLISHFTNKPQSTLGGFNLGGINATGQVSGHVLSDLR